MYDGGPLRVEVMQEAVGGKPIILLLTPSFLPKVEVKLSLSPLWDFSAILSSKLENGGTTVAWSLLPTSSHWLVSTRPTFNPSNPYLSITNATISLSSPSYLIFPTRYRTSRYQYQLEPTLSRSGYHISTKFMLEDRISRFAS